MYQPLPFVKTLYYMDLDLYRYFIGRSDQSVQEDVMVGRVDQQVRITKIMLELHDLDEVKAKKPKLAKYMHNYLSMMMTISSIFLMLDGSPEKLGMKAELWEYLKQKDQKLYRKMKYTSLSAVGNWPKPIALGGYRVVRKIYKVN